MRPAVLVYREVRRQADTVAELHKVSQRQRSAAPRSADDAIAVLIGAGETESAICDALFQEHDGVDARSAELRNISVAAARQYLAALSGDPLDAGLEARFDALLRMTLPAEIEMRPSEGYAYYALFPETYAVSAERLRDELRPRRVCVIGIRSIGTSLSAIVCAALERQTEVTSYTVRPRGHPFDRRVVLDHPLRAEWRRELQRGAIYAVVDEGPGLSGSSFASVVEALRELGVPFQRIVLLPSWDPRVEQLRSERARSTWTECRRYITSAAECGITPKKLFGFHDDGVDWSAGRWREHVDVDRACWPAVEPHHERWKTFMPRERRLLKFAGLGDYGAMVLQRARRLSSTSLAQSAWDVRHGFASLGFVDGKIAVPPFSDMEAETVGQYVGRRASEFGSSNPTRAVVADTVHMIRTNLRELFTEGLSPRALSTIEAVLDEAPTSDIDGRMLAHEWVRSHDTLMKVDAFEHGCDHFYPGPQNPAWDLAAAADELELDATAVRRMLEAYRRASGDHTAEERMAVYSIAYASFRAGYASMAAETLAGTDDGERFAHMRARERERLRRLIPSVL